MNLCATKVPLVYTRGKACACTQAGGGGLQHKRTPWSTLLASSQSDIAAATVTEVVGLGWIDRRRVPFDPSDRDGGPRIGTWPVFGMNQRYQCVEFLQKSGALAGVKLDCGKNVNHARISDRQ